MIPSKPACYGEQYASAFQEPGVAMAYQHSIADMAGNVFEWTTSLAWNYPYQLGDGRDDLERYGTRVRRGGAYTSEELFMRTTARQLSPPDGMSPMGFAARPTRTS
jgi:formylglycine-generating enzyme required for sulfatase activity